MIIYGAGGHAQVVFESLTSSGVEVKGVIDDDRKKKHFEDLAVQHVYLQEYHSREQIIIAIGSNIIRSALSNQISHDYGTCIDNSAYVSGTVIIGKGSMILQRTIIQSRCQIGNHVIVNSGAIVEHDCEIEDFVHLGPGSVVCGGSQIGQGTLVGANATILPGVKVGSWAKIGAGAVVVENVEQKSTVAGNPAVVI